MFFLPDLPSNPNSPDPPPDKSSPPPDNSPPPPIGRDNGTSTPPLGTRSLDKRGTLWRSINQCPAQKLPAGKWTSLGPVAGEMHPRKPGRSPAAISLCPTTITGTATTSSYALMASRARATRTPPTALALTHSRNSTTISDEDRN